MQPDLFGAPKLEIDRPDGMSEPRLWVRRLIVWRRPTEIIREITLRPGLNIIWSPDAGEQGGGPIGHGSGKTTLCRLLRYCLGEDSFAPHGQRSLMWNRFPDARVGAEVIIDGQPWAVVRSLGQRRDDLVVPASNLDELDTSRTPSITMAEFRSRLGATLLADAATLMPASIGEEGAWQATLAWLTRDQECRFSHLLDWRDPDSDSNSPVRGRSAEDRLTVVRALLRALTHTELEARQQETAAEADVATRRQEVERLGWQLQRVASRLRGAAFASLSGTGLDAAAVLEAARAELQRRQNTEDGGARAALQLLRVQRREAAATYTALQAELADVQARANVLESLIPLLESEFAERSNRLGAAENPSCPICYVPIDRALAEGCRISLASPNLEQLRTERDQKRQKLIKERDNLQTSRGMVEPLKFRTEAARQKLDQIDAGIERAETRLEAQLRSVMQAENMVAEAEAYTRLIAEREGRAAELRGNEEVLARQRSILAEHRAEVANIVAEVSARFDAVMRRLVGQDSKSEVRLTGNGLDLKVQLGGDRSTAAIESLKIVAFDLAVLTLAVEGRAKMPALLVHDSPREADLGRSIYNRLFDLAVELESSAPPLFQYILTTTTSPPSRLQQEPWLRLQLFGSPPEGRLLKCDLV